MRHRPAPAFEPSIAPVATLPSNGHSVLANGTCRSNQQVGVAIVRRVCEEPSATFPVMPAAKGIVVQKGRSNSSKNYGFNAATGDLQDLLPAAVIGLAKGCC